MKTFLLFVLMLSCGYYSTAQTKTIYLIRHAKSSHDDRSFGDMDRPLSDRGHSDSEKVAQRLKKHVKTPDLFLSSPAIRARQTSRYLCNELGFDYEKVQWDSSIYRCAPGVLLHAIEELDDQYNSVMIVAHNPAIASCAAYLQNDTVIDAMPTASVMAIEFKIDSWKDLPKSKGKMLFFEYPKRKVGN